ncbi:hypothetical protein FGQ65_03920 [Clavibacter nebraskensis]|nr:hypothetical protein FGQ65_03920 [Clavibacter nebraskensis]
MAQDPRPDLRTPYTRRRQRQNVVSIFPPNLAYGLRATGYGLRATGYGLRATGSTPHVRSRMCPNRSTLHGRPPLSARCRS